MNKVLPILLGLLLLVQTSLASDEGVDSLRREVPIPPVEYNPNWKSLILPAAMITTGAIFSQTDHRDIFNISRSDRYPRATPVDNILTMAIGPSLFLFDFADESKNKPLDQFFLLGTSYVFTAIPVLTIKYVFPEERPRGDGKYSFPSGHTALSFAGAHVIYKEFKDSNPWIAYSGYLLATGVGAARMYNNRHWLSDVLAGAGFGILGTELAYAAYFPVRKIFAGWYNEKYGIRTSLAPVVTTHSFGMNLSLRF
ncbi:phosphatase PAP2 family protein [Bacteroidales bacterium OttesenSCG-928-J19]|nr:phosphatase PAP2 family protein [Bacteroidales bacterium OttesenSCG-928-J19]